ncbi:MULTISPECIES: P27 family phage terminase small subunit [Bacteria]|uniref:P27 family phage terminase small subunit n=1 Tax=Bacteria TaxID=2 RepID=UPI003C7A04E2
MASTFRARTSWSAGAKRVFREVSEDHPDLEKSSLSALYAACDLLSEADNMQSQINEDGLMVKGSMGQDVAHPLISEVRQYRRAALDSIRGLGLSNRSGASAAASALANKRWAGRPANVTPNTRAAPF